MEDRGDAQRTREEAGAANRGQATAVKINEQVLSLDRALGKAKEIDGFFFPS